MTENILGIDYGTKRVGLAVLSSGATLAFPLVVLINNKSLIDQILRVINDRQITRIVIGESVDNKGVDNALMADIRAFSADLKNRLPEVVIDFEAEHYTSFQAERYQGKTSNTDAGAASIILQAWYDRQVQQKK